MSSELPPRYRIKGKNLTYDELIEFYCGDSKNDFDSFYNALMHGFALYPDEVGFEIWGMHFKQAKMVYDHGPGKTSIQPEV